MFHVDVNKPKSPYICEKHGIQQSKTLEAVENLLQVLTPCIGPGACLHIVQNNVGGHITVTSDSQRLLSSVSLSSTVLKLIVNAVLGHLRQFSDGGKFFSVSCLNLIKQTLLVDTESSNRAIFCDLYERFVKYLSKYLNAKNCLVCVRTDLSNITILLSLVRSLVASRPLLDLTKNDCEQICQLLVRCFVQSIPEQTQGGSVKQSTVDNNIFIVESVNNHMRESCLIPGLLLQCSQLRGLNLDTILKSSDGSVKVALVTCSMSGDIESIISATFEVSKEGSDQLEGVILGKWTDLCERLSRHNVRLLLCQKVIHPRLKVLLKSLNILHVDRLGSSVIPHIQELTGARPIMSVCTFEPENFTGVVPGLEHKLLSDKSYLHLQQPTTSSLYSLILCAKTEQVLEEFKSCVKSCLKCLFSLLKDGRLLSGGGCWQMHCSYWLDRKVKEELLSLISITGCTEQQVLCAVSIFRRAVFHSWSRHLVEGHSDGSRDQRIDPLSWHSWVVKQPSVDGRWLTCECGLISSKESYSFLSIDEQAFTQSIHPKYDMVKDDVSFKDNNVTNKTVLDHFSSMSQALYKSVFTANLVLNLGWVITDGH